MERGVSAIFSRRDRGGQWTVPPASRVFVFGGKAQLDLRWAHFHPGTTTIEVLAIMGEAKILVPHGMRVECDGRATVGKTRFGEFSVKHISPRIPRDDAPLLHITGRAIMASVFVRVVDPDAPGLGDKVRALLLGE